MRMVGQQTLAVFLTGLVVAQLAGMVMDAIGRGMLTSLLVNLAGCAVLVAAAKVTETFKSPPWRKGHAAARGPRAEHAPSPAEDSAPAEKPRSGLRSDSSSLRESAGPRLRSNYNL